MTYPSTTAPTSPIATASVHGASTTQALKFITCGSVDDGKSTLIGRLLVDSRSVLQDQLAGVQRSGETDLALLTDGLSAEREQGITIDVAYRYFSTSHRKFIIGDAPGHEQYTRNMVTAASSADAAVVLVDATKLDWANPALTLLPQTRRHSLLLKLLRVPHIVVAINKLDAVPEAQAAQAFAHIKGAIEQFATEAGIALDAILPISALKGWNVVSSHVGWCDYGTQPDQKNLLEILESLGTTPTDQGLPFALPVQWVEKFASSSDTDKGRRVFWGRVAAGVAQVGDEVTVLPSGQKAVVAQVLSHARQPGTIGAGHSAGLVLDREIDVSRGDWLLAPNAYPASQGIRATVAWMDDEPLVPGRVYWALHGHRWVKAKVAAIHHQIDITTLAQHPATELKANQIGDVDLALQEPIATQPFAQARQLGSLILVDTASHKTSGAVLVQ
jgi:sulfate adenylyltransferase subunit 1